MQTKIKVGFGWLATGLLLLPLGANAGTSMGSSAREGRDTQSQGTQGHADSDRWVGTPSQATPSQPTRADSSRNDAQTSGDLARRDASRSSSSQGRVRNISARFEQNVGDQCQFRGTVRGTVREVAVQGATADNATQFTPDLRIQSELSCADGSARHAVTASLRGPQYAREQLAQAIQDRARIFSSRNGQVCSYAPRLAFDNGRLASNGIAQSCMTARGGGPGNIEEETSPLLRTPTGTIAPQQGTESPSGSMMNPAPANDSLRDNGMQQMPSTGAGPGVPGNDIQQGQPSVDDTLNNRANQPMDTTGTGQDISPSTGVNTDATRSNPPIRQRK